MESVFIFNGALFRVDGLVWGEDSLQFWAERLDGKFEGTEDYRIFQFADLIKSQQAALSMAITDTCPEPEPS